MPLGVLFAQEEQHSQRAVGELGGQGFTVLCQASDQGGLGVLRARRTAAPGKKPGTATWES